MHTLAAVRAGLVLAFAGVVGSLLGCGVSPVAEPARVPPNAVRVVRADEVKGTCQCDDDDLPVADAPSAKPIEYVKIDQWVAPPQVAGFEATAPARALAPSRGHELGPLTLHQPIPATTVTTWRRFRGR